MLVEEQVPLAPYTTFRIGGPARYFARVRSVEELRESLEYAKVHALRVFVLGGGSNILVADEGFDGLVIKIELAGVEQEGEMLVAGAGESWDALVERAVHAGLWGIENLSGVPGTVGGAAVQNIGAYGAALSQTCVWVEVLDTTTGEVRRLAAGECGFGYRDNIFKREEGRYVVLRAALGLSAAASPDVSYKDLAARFAGAVPGLKELRAAVLDIRAGKFPDLRVSGTAGSFFKNPILPEAQARQLQTQYPGMPLFALPESGEIKVPLGWFLDYRHGVIDLRETRAGGARMYEKHFLVAVAESGASAHDVRELADIVQKKVLAACGIVIEPEVKIIS